MELEHLIYNYLEWLKDEISFEKIGAYYEITTPYLDSSNDYLQIYVRQEGDEVFFSDDGYIIGNLQAHGFIFTPARKQHLKQLLYQYGVTLKGNELTAQGNISQFAPKKHLFLQAMLRVDDMCHLAKEKAPSFFFDDVKTFFDGKEIFYSENVQFTGKSGFQHNYDFLLQRSRNRPERLCLAINTPNKTTMGNALFAWSDTKPSRKNDSQLIVILNDSKSVSKKLDDGFESYGVFPIRWSERNNPSNIEILSA